MNRAPGSIAGSERQARPDSEPSRGTHLLARCQVLAALVQLCGHPPKLALCGRRLRVSLLPALKGGPGSSASRGGLRLCGSQLLGQGCSLQSGNAQLRVALPQPCSRLCGSSGDGLCVHQPRLRSRQLLAAAPSLGRCCLGAGLGLCVRSLRLGPRVLCLAAAAFQGRAALFRPRELLLERRRPLLQLLL